MPFSVGIVGCIAARESCGVDRCDELVLAQAGRVGDDAVVGKNLQLACGEEDSEEGVCGGAFTPFCSALLGDAGGGGGAMMPICDVSMPYRAKGYLYCTYRDIARDAPHALMYVVWSHEVIERGALLRCVEDDIYRHAVLIGEKHRAGLRAYRLYVVHAVLFLCRERELVLADSAIEVVVHCNAAHKSQLRMGLGRELIEVETGLFVGHEHAVELPLA